MLIFFIFSLSWIVCFEACFFLHRHERIPGPFSAGQEDEPPNNHSAITTPAHRIPKTLTSSQTTAATRRPLDSRTDCQQAVRHTTIGALRNSQGLDRELGKERGGGGREAKTEDDPKPTEAQLLHTLQPNKSFTLGNSLMSDIITVVWTWL